MLYISNVKMPTPSALSVELTDRGDFSALNVLGQRLADRTGVKREIELEWPYLTGEQLAQLFTAVSATVFFEAKYPDPMTGEDYTATCRCVERAAHMHHLEDGAAVWTDIHMRWEER